MSNDSQLIISVLRQKGLKITKTRARIINLLTSRHSISVPEILSEIKKDNLPINKTTVYRIIECLVDQGLIKQIDLRERGRRYELLTKSHHHHLVCIKCKQIQSFELEGDLDELEKYIKQTANFEVLDHSLEFYGFCTNCQTR